MNAQKAEFWVAALIFGKFAGFAVHSLAYLKINRFSPHS